MVFFYNSEMTEIITAESVRLLSVFAAAEDALQSNFRDILNALRRHERRFEELWDALRSNDERTSEAIRLSEFNKSIEIEALSRKLEHHTQLIGGVSERQSEHERLIVQSQSDAEQMRRDITEKAVTVNAQLEERKSDHDRVDAKVGKAQSDICKVWEEIATAKEDAVEGRRARHTLEAAMEKLERTEKQCKSWEGKLQQL
jgi:chromosome segregation ATPase